ncbi:MAG: DUF2339 domain-containing protein, partial [Victivallales bacterium]|nr:DUF2339 domain-containing protein [Victivallales bacterium]
ATNKVRGMGWSPAGLFLTFAGLFLFIYLQVELRYCCLALLPMALMPALTFVWVAALALALWRINCGNIKIGYIVAMMLLLGLVAKFCLVDFNFWHIIPLSGAYFYPYTGWIVLMRALDFLPAVAILLLAMRILSRREQSHAVVFGIIALLLLFFYLTFEVGSFMQYFLPGMKAGAISLLWGIYAFALIWRGIVRDRQVMRFTGLGLFALTIIKIFLVDMAQLTPVYKFSAFISLGLVVLVGALIYVRFRERFKVPVPATAKEKHHEDK